MRKFKLWNKTKTSSFDFEQEGIIITEVSGLGIGYTPTMIDNVVVNYKKSFDSITLLANFGIKSNAYTDFTNLATFISNNGKNNLILEYSVNGRTLYSDVWLTRMPKSQKTNFNILSETLTFTRTSHWYYLFEGTIPAEPSYLEVENVLDDNIELIVTIRSPTPENFRITARVGLNPISEIIIPNAMDALAITLTSDAERKVVERFNAGQITNGYNDISRAGDTFIVLGKGTYRINTNQVVPNAPLIKYKKWVLD